MWCHRLNMKMRQEVCIKEINLCDRENGYRSRYLSQEFITRNPTGNKIRKKSVKHTTR